MTGFRISRSMRRWLIVSLMISTSYIVLIGGMPSIAPFTPHDDTLFQKIAYKLANGDWLGRDYNSQVLAKGAFHSIQMSFAYRLGIPIGLWFQALYLVAAWFFCTLALRSSSIWLRVLCYLSFLFDPWQFTVFGIRLLREETYIPFLIFALTFFISALDHVKKNPRESSQFIQPSAIICFLLLLSGLSFGLLLITREARIFVYLSISIACFVLILWYINVYGLSKSALSKAVSFVLVFVALFPVPFFLTSVQNYSAYGLFISNEFEDGQFKNFYQDLISIKPAAQQEKPWVPVQS